MAHTDSNESANLKVWFLDSGCSNGNHICGYRNWLFELNENYRTNVRIGDDSKVSIMGKGSVKMRLNDIIQIITNVYYIPKLKNNLLSVGQFQERGLKVVFVHSSKDLIIDSHMSSNRMFKTIAVMITPTCLKVSDSEDASL